MPQRFMFEGHWYTIDQIKAIKARREKEEKENLEKAKENQEDETKPVSKMSKEELEKALTKFEVDFSKAKNVSDLRKLLKDYLESIPKKEDEEEDTTEKDK